MYEQCLVNFRMLGDKIGIAASLHQLALVLFLSLDDQVRLGLLLEEDRGSRESVGTAIPPVERATYEQSVLAVQTQLGEAAFTLAWAEGRTMTPEQALVAQASSRVPVSPPVLARSSYPADLTAREVEVLRLAAQGLIDAQVASQLVNSPRTVNWHLTSIYSKLAVSSRAAATRYAIEHKLV